MSSHSILAFAQKIKLIEEDITWDDVVAALKLVRKFAQKNNLDNDVASLRNIERELFVQKARKPVTPNKPKLIHFLIIHSHTCKYSKMKNLVGFIIYFIFFYVG